MKKTYFILAAASAMVAASACSGKADKATTPAEEATAKVETTAEYAGTVPGADVEGIRYTVKLTAVNDSTGTYDMTQDYVNGTETVQSFDSKGDYVVIAKDGAKYVKIGEGAGATYFRCDADTALTMVNVDLELPIRPADYTLTRTK